MTTDRCPACGAAVAPGAPWCTLCFADLRPKPEPEPASEPVVVPEASSELVVAPTDSPEPVYAAASAPLAAPAALTPPSAVTPTPPADPTWPCSSCGAAVGFDLNACPSCGTSFLADIGGGSLDIQLPGNVDPRQMSSQAKWAVAGVGALAVMLVFLVIAVVGGALL